MGPEFMHWISALTPEASKACRISPPVVPVHTSLCRLAIAAAISRQVPIAEYEPRKIKQAITGNGAASKVVFCPIDHVGLAVVVCYECYSEFFFHDSVML